jgi:hypothetical protein
MVQRMDSIISRQSEDASEAKLGTDLMFDKKPSCNACNILEAPRNYY